MPTVLSCNCSCSALVPPLMDQSQFRGHTFETEGSTGVDVDNVVQATMSNSLDTLSEGRQLVQFRISRVSQS